MVNGRYVVDEATGCWVWTGATSSTGYGYVRRNGRHIGAHRAAWIDANGPIPPGMQVCHRCDNPPCVNPEHLFLGFATDNMEDKEEKGRGLSGRGQKLTLEQARAIFNDPRIHREIAAEYGVSRILVLHIKQGKKWARALSKQPVSTSDEPLCSNPGKIHSAGAADRGSFTANDSPLSTSRPA